jgi:hypothetical protein
LQEESAKPVICSVAANDQVATSAAGFIRGGGKHTLLLTGGVAPGKRNSCETVQNQIRCWAERRLNN